ncbi:MAG TPA: isopentenyl phosphate kinase family protein [Anaerolineae bacterium]|nr:isopentenyl phosphate kinase family protein [Anaerolineae bacterium]
MIFLKLGGSLITDKKKPETARLDRINRISREIVKALNTQPDIQLVLGHGSGSFGHTAAKKYRTRDGVKNESGWNGFIKVWKTACALNQLVMGSLYRAGAKAISIPPSGSIVTDKGIPIDWDIRPILHSLKAKIIPVIYGDVVYDNSKGGTILSTEELFRYLALKLNPDRILLAGLEEGVWENSIQKKKLINKITPQTYPFIEKSIKKSSAVDVTGGMKTKVDEMLQLVTKLNNVEIVIFSARKEESLFKALTGDINGTIISAE